MNEDRCEFIRSDLSCDEALAVLDPFFEVVREVFVAYERADGGSSRLQHVRVECAPWVHDTPRHFAGATEDGRRIFVTPELVELPENTVVAILAHEFGHAMDFCYPARYVWSPDGLIVQNAAPVSSAGKRHAQAIGAAMRQWRDRDADTVERTADAIAERVTGRSIGYTGPCRLQSLDAGTARPAGLR